MTFSAKDFIAANTIAQTVPFLPELTLHLATEVTPLWQMTEQQFGETNLPPPFWAFAWPGGQGLARYVLDHPDVVKGRRVLDFASGCGMASIAAHKSGAAKVMASDIDPLAMAALHMNATLNKAVVEDVGIVRMDKPFKGADVIFAGDVCYQQAMSAAVTRWLRLCVESGTKVLLADPGRAWVPQEGLMECARYLVPTSLELEDTMIRNVTVWEMVAVR